MMNEKQNKNHHQSFRTQEIWIKSGTSGMSDGAINKKGEKHAPQRDIHIDDQTIMPIVSVDKPKLTQFTFLWKIISVHIAFHSLQSIKVGIIIIIIIIIGMFTHNQFPHSNRWLKQEKSTQSAVKRMKKKQETVIQNQTHKKDDEPSREHSSDSDFPIQSLPPSFFWFWNNVCFSLFQYLFSNSHARLFCYGFNEALCPMGIIFAGKILIFLSFV